MPRGRKPTCECGTCKKCRVREYNREYQRRYYHEKLKVDETFMEAKRATTRAYAAANHERVLEAKRQYAKTETFKESQRRYREEHPERRRAQLAVRDALRRGEMTRGVCEACGQVNAEAHHDDYDKPLDVRWLCRRHHVEHHRQAKAA